MLNNKNEKLACCRCGKEISYSYEPGYCYDDQSEPAISMEHDEAELWDEIWDWNE